MPAQRVRGVCRTCKQSRIIYPRGLCSTCYRGSGHATREKISPVAPGSPPMIAPIYCACTRPADPNTGQCLKCFQQAHYQPPPVPYYPEIAA